MTTKEFDFVLDGPRNFFGAGRSTFGIPTREAFDNMVNHYRALGKTVHVHENHHPVFAVIEPRPKDAALPAFDMSRMQVSA